jgi:hypothetical protein
MAKFGTGFSEYTVNQTPSDWMKRFTTSGANYNVYNNVSGASDGYALYHSISVLYSHYMLSWNAVNASDVEIVAKVRMAATNARAYLIARASGTTNPTYYRCNLVDGGSGLTIQKVVSGSVTTLGTYDFTWSANTWYWIRFRVIDTSLKARVWSDGSQEPSNWQIETTDNSISSGWVGIGSYPSSSTGIYYDYFGTGTGGDTAPATALRPPEVATQPATNVDKTTATLNGVISNTWYDDPTRYIEYGLTTSYGTVVNIGVGGTGAFSVNVSGLNPNTTYHYRVYATNSAGTSYGTDQTFTTGDYIRATQLAPNDISISPLESNVFAWHSNGTQTHYELRYRKVADPDWITTGTVESATAQHILPADTLDIDAEYEWQVKSWDSAHPTWYDWSNVASFNTINPPVISELAPSADSTVELGIVEISAKATSIYGRDCRLVLLVANNAEYANPQSYQTGFFSSGEIGSITIGLARRGVNYLRLTAEDSEGLTQSIDYTLEVIHTLYFIEEPQVVILGPQATHVTVRVKNSSPVVEHTAHVTPEPGPDKIIERLVEIDSGTASTCQAVAEQLVTRWGREQKTVTGNINLTVTLSFKEKVYIIIPDAGIDEEMILQEKSHNVTEAITTITCGDIILDDSELLARILDELGK